MMTRAAEGSKYFTDLPTQSALLVLACFNRPLPGPFDQARQLHCGRDWSYFIWFTQPEGDSDIDTRSPLLHDAMKVVDEYIYVLEISEDLLFSTPKIQAAIVFLFFFPPSRSTGWNLEM